MSTLSTPSPMMAAVDLGSNSFRLEIGYFRAGQFHRVEYLKRTLRQGAGLLAGAMLSDAALQAGWDCLAEFGEHLCRRQVRMARVVATQTLREAGNGPLFVARGSTLLGFPIEVISGEQEAALIYHGVQTQLPPSNDRRLVMDLGGRSTELALGQGHQIQALASYPVGSVGWTKQFFADGQLTVAAFDQAQAAAQATLATASTLFPPGSWDRAYATAGTASAVGDVLAAHGQPAHTMTQQDLHWLRAQLLACGTIETVHLPGLRADKAPVVAGGLAVLLAVFEVLQLTAMQPAQGALRLGLLHSLRQSVQQA